MKFGDVLLGIFILIAGYLIFSNWKAANTLMLSGASASIGMVRTLQGRT